MKKYWIALTRYLQDHPLVIMNLLLITGIAMRLLYSGNLGISFDQVQILTSAKEILHGHLLLIGPRTAPASIFTGPLIYYLAAPFVYVFGDRNTVILLPIFISLVTGNILFLLIQKYMGTKEAVIGTLIWTFSPFLINLDRILWNPDLSLLSAALLFFPLLEKKTDKITLFLLCTGAFLAWQAHFSGLILIALSCASVFYLWRPRKYLFYIALGLFVSLIPTAIFDIRNNFLNMRGLIEFFSTKREFHMLNLLKDFARNIYIVVETLGKLFIFGLPTPFIITFGIFCVALALHYVRVSKRIRLCFLWLLSMCLMYSLYHGNKPEYYFSIGIPAMLVISITILKKFPTTTLVFILGIFVVGAVRLILRVSAFDPGFTLNRLDRIHQLIETMRVKDFTYDMKYGADVGIRYYLSDIPRVEDGKIVHITTPNNYTFNGIHMIDDIAVWEDPRVGNRNYLTELSYILSTSHTYPLARNVDATNVELINVYKILDNGIEVGRLSIIRKDMREKEASKACDAVLVENTFVWSASQQSYLYSTPTYCVQVKADQRVVNQLDLKII